jgi:hypothetical protein
MTSLQCLQQPSAATADDDERSDSSRCLETAAQYCSRYMTAVAQLGRGTEENDEDFNSGGSGGSGSWSGSGIETLSIAFKQSCGGEAYCWLYGQVIRFMDDKQDDALIQVFSPVHMRYYNVVSASHNRSVVAIARISLKASQANLLIAAQRNYYCYSYHPAAQPEKKRKSISGNQHNGKRRLSAAMVLLSSPPPKQQLQRKDEDVNIDFDLDFAFMPMSVANESTADCLALNFDQCDLDNDYEGITEEELVALFNASSTEAATEAPSTYAVTSDDGETDDLSLPRYACDDRCNRCDDDTATDIY